ncbi:uncharacterized protein LOC131665710 [Phymastichus coffea]|uniref:uncharacterized protein LOC131665710 n=1 Tax=Phymastichus coffea TaxID=108790 RepID=UPI00273A9B35|nr:uncharacterized protein LOC131665710 [Phymastichus coffea]
MLRFVVLCGLVAATFAAPAQEQQASFLEDAYNLYNSCSAEADIAVCLKLKALGFVDRAARSAQIEVIDGFKIVQNEDAKSRVENARSLNEIEASLPVEIEARDAAINDALVDRAARFLTTHTIEISLPEEARSLEESRGKKKKKQIMENLKSALSLLKLKAALFLPIAIIGFKLLVLKALVFSKIALILSLVLVVKKFLEKRNVGGHENTPHDVPYHHDEYHGAGYGRSLEMAYSAHKPATA